MKDFDKWCKVNQNQIKTKEVMKKFKAFQTIN